MLFRVHQAPPRVPLTMPPTAGLAAPASPLAFPEAAPTGCQHDAQVAPPTSTHPCAQSETNLGCSGDTLAFGHPPGQFFHTAAVVPSSPATEMPMLPSFATGSDGRLLRPDGPAPVSPPAPEDVDTTGMPAGRRPQ